MGYSRGKVNALLTVVFLFFGALTFSGCAGGGGAGLSGRLSSQMTSINKKSYFPISAVCRYYGFSWEWDGFSRVITLKKEGMSIKLFPGSSLVLYNDRSIDLKAPIILHDGLVMVPASFARLFMLTQEKTGPAPVKYQAKKEGFYAIKKIIIDAGHGGKDPGASVHHGLREKEINLDVAKRLARELRRKGIQVVMTRDTDVFYSLYRRAEIANKNNGDFFICIHTNAARTRSAHGAEEFYLSSGYDDFSKASGIRGNAAAKFAKKSEYKNSHDLNTILWDMALTEDRKESVEMAYSIAKEFKRMLNLRTRFVHGARFVVLKDTQMPAILIEVGYITNPTENARLNNPFYRQMLAEAIASGIMNYKKNYDNNNGFSD